MRRWFLGHGRSLDLGRCHVIAILNATPDSFYGPSRVRGAAGTVEAARRAVGAGASMLDIGGESTRPGAARVDAAEQIERIVPAIEAIRREAGALGSIPVSVDTTLEAVARAGLDAGADVINDVAAGTEDEGIFRVAAEHGAGLILMHRLRPPGADSFSDAYATPPHYDDVVAEVGDFLERRVAAAAACGVQRERIVVDPGLGFGKTVGQNLQLVRAAARLEARLGLAVLSAASRKSFVGRVSLGRDSTPEERLAGSLAITLFQARNGVRLFRVHDVGEHVRALNAAAALGECPSVAGAADAPTGG